MVTGPPRACLQSTGFVFSLSVKSVLRSAFSAAWPSLSEICPFLLRVQTHSVAERPTTGISSKNTVQDYKWNKSTQNVEAQTQSSLHSGVVLKTRDEFNSDCFLQTLPAATNKDFSIKLPYLSNHHYLCCCPPLFIFIRLWGTDWLMMTGNMHMHTEVWWKKETKQILTWLLWKWLHGQRSNVKLIFDHIWKWPRSDMKDLSHSGGKILDFGHFSM